ncbi:MAG: type II secretion system protein [bacterium]|nr:type II secretion system protein [bacterium]
MKYLKIKNKKAFSLIELLVTIAIIALLASMILPTLSNAKLSAKKITCINNLHQLDLSLIMYADDNEQYFPIRGGNSSNKWPAQLETYYSDLKILKCPNDLDPKNNGQGSNIPSLEAPRSYIFNGFNDYFKSIPPNNSVVPEGIIKEPSETIVFGEKDEDSGHWWMDYWMGDDYQELDQTKHKNGSEYSFADGSTRFLKFGESLDPINLWFIDDSLRDMGSASF